jgi:hypothetical protein
MTEPEDFQSVKGNTIQRKISVDYISFSAHVDYSQNSEFIETIKAQHVVSLDTANFILPTHPLLRCWCMGSKMLWVDYGRL